METINSFPPVINKHSLILIIGSMPGVESLNRQQYYAYKYNQFWRIIYKLFKQEPEERYEQKLQFLLKNRMALWDVLGSCIREGSLDNNIKDEVVNNFNVLLNNYPAIKHICFNGKKAQASFERKIRPTLQREDLTYLALPSTSPAHTMGFDEKFRLWEKVKSL